MRPSRRFAGWLVALLVASGGCSSVDPGGTVPDAAARDGGRDGAPDVAVTPDARPDVATDTPIGPAPDAQTTPDGGGIFSCLGTGTGVDPYPTLTTPGDYTDPTDCASGRCPAVVTGFVATPNADHSVAQISGTSEGAGPCRFVVVGNSSGVEEGTLATNPDGGGTFSGSVPLFCGANRVEVICCADHGDRIHVVDLDGRTCPGDDLRLTLTWDGNVRDGELHLIQAGSHINDPMHDCTWTTCIPPRVLDWGAVGVTTDNPVKDVDNTSTSGTEHITLTSAPAGTYDIMSEHWNSSGVAGMMTMEINVQGHAPIVRSVPSIAAHWVWYVGTITFPGGAFTPSDAMAPPHTPPLTDCTGTQWTGPGCGLPIPQ